MGGLAALADDARARIATQADAAHELRSPLAALRRQTQALGRAAGEQGAPGHHRG